MGLCLIAAGCSRTAAPPTGELLAFTGQLDARMPEWLQRYGTSGAAVAIVQRGEVRWVKGYGLADVAQGVPVTAETVFQVASISKPVTAWGVMRLAQQGLIALDAPVETYLTRWHLPSSDYNAETVTVRRLLSHSAGLSVHGYPGLSPEQPLPSLEASLSGDNGGAGEVRLTMEPGAQYSYSGGGYTLLQLIVEEVTGEPFSAYMQREILEPLGMHASSFEWRTDLRPATATGYNAAQQPYPNYRFTEQAAAGLYTTAPDLARFVAAALAGPNGEPAGPGMLNSDTLAWMATPTIALQGIEGNLLNVSMGLGYYIETLADGTKAISHSGSNRGWQSELMALPDRGAGIVILTNSDQGALIGMEVLSAWGRWLGVGAPAKCKVYQGVRSGTLGLTVLLGLGLMFKIMGFAKDMRDGRRQWLWRFPIRRKIWRYAGLVLSFLLSALIAAGWWLAVHPVLSSLAPGQAPWLMLNVGLWCIYGAVAALLRPTSTVVFP
ncbi:MAG TPA: serine hydrolase domain-containing protein [Anaerolineae bacterium]|nr:serine hydrolase domain-containing protein [Anaerolineae bacterium]